MSTSPSKESPSLSTSVSSGMAIADQNRVWRWAAVALGPYQDVLVAPKNVGSRLG